MNPKEKALELLMKYENVTCPNWEIGNNKYTKQCALIAVEEFLSFQEHLFITEGSIAYKYWQEVKQEIEKL